MKVSLSDPVSLANLIVWILLKVWITGSQRQAPQAITIGGIFEEMYEGSEMAFKHAVEKINSRQDLLPNIKLSYDINRCPPQDSFTADRRVCQQLKEGVAAVFGPMSSMSASHVRSICDAMEIPHVTSRWDYSENKDFFSINLYPHYLKLSEAFVDFIIYSHWTSFVILYDTDDGLAKLQELLTAPHDHQFKITVRKLTPEARGMKHDYRPILKEIRNTGTHGMRMVLDVDYTKVHDILYQAMTINMTTQYYHYLLTTLDADLIDLEDFKYSGVNITAFRMIDPTRPEVMEIIRDWDFQKDLSGRSPIESNIGYGFRTEAALMYDAVHLFAKALDELSEAQVIQTASLSCNKGKPWDKGSSLINFMKMTKTQGLTGLVQFDGQGRRHDFDLEVTELAKPGMEKIGYWNTRVGLNVTRDFEKDVKTITAIMRNKTLVVTTIKEDPYMMLVDDPNHELKGNDRFEGYCVDLLREIAKIRNFTYEIRLVEDGQYGAEDNGEWTGMVRELMDDKADLAVASLTISYIREQVIDFTKPFMNLGISIIYKKPLKKNPSLFSFLAPLSFEIWVYMLAAYLLVSLLLFVLARFSPYEWYNPHPCNPDSDVVENQFTLMNSLWFTIGSLMQQGSEVAPRAISTRIISGIWWFFTLIMISSYTANLAAFLTVERMTSPIENADDLSKQTNIKYGTLRGGSTRTFFETSTIPTYERMWNFMSSERPSVFTNTTKEGIERVLQKDYAFLLESTMNEYNTYRNCDLMRVGGLLDSKGYGIGTPRGSPYRDLISDAILKLQEDQILQRMYNKWWKEKGGAKQCDAEDNNKKDANSLNIANVGGVFVVLVAGLLLSLIVGVLEFVYKSQKNADEDKHHVRQSVCSEMAEELRFAIKCMGPSTKPVKKRHRGPDTVDGNGMTLTVPLTGYPPNHTYSPSKEYYT